MMYSPGSENVAVVLTMSFSIVGVLSANLISPGPRYFVSVVLTRGRRGGPCGAVPAGGGAAADPPVGGSSLPSSVIQYLIATLSPTAPLRTGAADSGGGGPVSPGPASLNLIVGGLLPIAASRNGSI
jgi:hypothetical protein